MPDPTTNQPPGVIWQRTSTRGENFPVHIEWNLPVGSQHRKMIYMEYILDDIIVSVVVPLLWNNSNVLVSIVWVQSYTFVIFFFNQAAYTMTRLYRPVAKESAKYPSTSVISIRLRCSKESKRKKKRTLCWFSTVVSYQFFSWNILNFFPPNVYLLPGFLRLLVLLVFFAHVGYFITRFKMYFIFFLALL